MKPTARNEKYMLLTLSEREQNKKVFKKTKFLVILKNWKTEITDRLANKIKLDEQKLKF